MVASARHKNLVARARQFVRGLLAVPSGLSKGEVENTIVKLDICAWFDHRVAPQVNRSFPMLKKTVKAWLPNFYSQWETLLDGKEEFKVEGFDPAASTEYLTEWLQYHAKHEVMQQEQWQTLTDARKVELREIIEAQVGTIAKMMEQVHAAVTHWKCRDNQQKVFNARLQDPVPGVFYIHWDHADRPG